MDNEEVEAFVDKIIKGTTQYLQTMFMKKFYKKPPDTSDNRFRESVKSQRSIISSTERIFFLPCSY